MFTPNTALPRDLPASVKKLARSVTDGKATKFEQAVALQQFFRVDGGFRYSLRRDRGNGTDDLVQFLSTDGRVGYCEQFAAAMALMGRTIGIPSRVAVGFLRPDRVAPSTYVYSSHDLHAWPEMYFGGIGWVRFEPTPQDRATGVPAYTTQQVPRPAPSESSSAPAAAPTLNRIDRATDPNAAVGGNGPASPLTNPVVVGSALALLVLVLLALAPRTARTLVRRRRWAAAGTGAALVEAGWDEVRDTAVDLGVAFDDRVTLRTAAHDLVLASARPGDQDDALGRSAHRGPGRRPRRRRAPCDRLVRPARTGALRPHPAGRRGGRGRRCAPTSTPASPPCARAPASAGAPGPPGCRPRSPAAGLPAQHHPPRPAPRPRRRPSRLTRPPGTPAPASVPSTRASVHLDPGLSSPRPGPWVTSSRAFS